MDSSHGWWCPTTGATREQLYQDELGQYQGSLTRATMARVNHALGLALALI
jgi:hypothetical protein